MMNSNKIGLVLLHVGQMRNVDVVRTRTRRAMDLTPQGRIMGAILKMPRRWTAGLNLESIITDAVLGRAGERSEGAQWEFFGNLAIRHCTADPAGRNVQSEQAVLLFRRAGELTYLRRKEVPAATLEAARLQSLHPVFTRDVANNVWHLRAEDKDALVARLTMLLTWPDEKTLELQARGQSVRKVRREDLDRALIGVPRKIDYEWRALGATSSEAATLFQS